VIAINITNRHLNLAPVVLGLAQAYQMQSVRVFSEPNQGRLSYRADWMLLTRNPAVVAAIPSAPPPPNAHVRAIPPLLWTDHYSNLFQILE
jgi:hypothetical protein